MRVSSAPVLFLVALSCLLAACDDDGHGTAATATPTHTATTVPTSTHTTVPTSTATAVPTSTPTVPPTATSTAPPTLTATATETEVPTATSTPDRSTLLAELTDTGIGRYLGRPVPTPSGFEGNWQRFDFAAKDEGPICLYGTDYRVYVRPGTSNNVLFYLEGGGGCWNDDTCWNDTRAKIDANPLAPLDLFPGVFQRLEPSNPFTDWNIVYVPYCDGSVFAGDNIADYEQGRVWHRGVSNLSTGVDVMKSLFPNPDKIVVSGSSAGGFGTLSGYGVMRVAYPSSEILVLNDSGPGIQNQDDAEARNDRESNWRLAQFFPRSCTLCLGQPLFVVDWALQRDPTFRMGLFSTLHDYVIRDFLALTGEQYAELLLDISGRVHSRTPERMKRFFVDDDFHTILLGAGIEPGESIGRAYRTLRVGNTLLKDWVKDFESNGPAWQDIVEGQ